LTFKRSDLRDIARRAMIERGLLPDFSADAMTEALGLAEAAVGAAPAVRDLRDRPWASIDNDDSRDLDQLSVAEPLAGDHVRILVAIADVDASVPRGSAIDDHARANTTSVYTAAGVFSMLPERLSTDLTSLNQDADRMAIVISLDVAGDGLVKTSEVYRAIVRNRAKLAYNSVAAWLEGASSAPPAIAAVPGLEANLRVQDRAAQAMKGLRHKHGALSLETIEPRPVFDGDELSDLRPGEKNRATELIEDFMIAANGAVARFLAAKKFPSIRRVLRTPERWDRIVSLVESAGGRLPATPDAEALEQFLNRQRRDDPERFADFSLAVIKLLGSGEYGVETPGQTMPGHFGLAVRDYTHSTAPNRRFPDLMTERLVKAALNGSTVPYSADELTQLARHCTVQEDNAEKVERQVRKAAAALLMQSRIGQEFDGIVTGASAKGTWVRTKHPLVEGRVVDGFNGLDVGDRVKVTLVRVDVERGFIDFRHAR
jgi:exoribonuclease-2